MIWSWSAIEVWQICPEQFAHKYVWKDLTKMPKTPEQQKGIDLHELYDKSTTARQPISPLQASVLKAAEGKELVTELHLAIDANLKPIGYWSQEGWGRGIIDVGLIGARAAWLGDWKTGKTKEKPGQLEIFALFGFVHWPQVQEISTCNLWIKTGKTGTIRTFRRDEVPHLLAGIIKPVNEIERAVEANAFPRRPGPLCGWCDATMCPLNPLNPRKP